MCLVKALSQHQVSPVLSILTNLLTYYILLQQNPRDAIEYLVFKIINLSWKRSFSKNNPLYPSF